MRGRGVGGWFAIKQGELTFISSIKLFRFELLARLCPNSTGAEIRSVCTEAGMFAIRARRKVRVQGVPRCTVVSHY